MRPPRLRAGIPLKLLLVSSLLLFIPWLGLQYFRELERLLRQVQEQALVSTARAVATALNDRPNVLLSGEVYSAPADPLRDLNVPNLARPIVLDGRVEDWSQPGLDPRSDAVWTESGGLFSFRYRIGRHGASVFVLFEVQDDRVVLRDPERADLAGDDQLRISLVTADDEFLRFAVDAEADGPLTAWLLHGDGSRLRDSRISGVWRTTADGYLAELRGRLFQRLGVVSAFADAHVQGDLGHLGHLHDVLVAELLAGRCRTRCSSCSIWPSCACRGR